MAFLSSKYRNGISAISLSILVGFFYCFAATDKFFDFSSYPATMYDIGTLLGCVLFQWTLSLIIALVYWLYKKASLKFLTVWAKCTFGVTFFLLCISFQMVENHYFSSAMKRTDIHNSSNWRSTKLRDRTVYEQDKNKTPPSSEIYSEGELADMGVKLVPIALDEESHGLESVLSHVGKTYFSKDDGFEVLFSDIPSIHTVEDDAFILRNYQAHSLADGSVTQYSVSFYSLKNGKIFDDASIDAFLKNAPGKAGTVLKQKRVLFEGFTGIEFEVKVHHHNIDWIQKGVEFFVDGDPIRISVLESVNVVHSSYESFKKSFKLQPIDMPISDSKWSNEDVEFYPPKGWKNNKEKMRIPYIAGFSNDSGISIELMRAPLKEASCNDMRGFIKPHNVDDNNFFKTEFEIPEYNIQMKTISACLEKREFTYVLSGKAPEETFFRWSFIFENSLKTLKSKK